MTADSSRASRPNSARTVGPFRRRLRAIFTRAFCWLVVRAMLRPRLEDVERLPTGPALLCFNHLNWADPLVLLAALPMGRRIALFGPKEEDMRVGRRNRLMAWTGLAVPYKPGKNDLLDTTRRVQAVFAAGSSVAIAGEGRIHVGERALLPLNEGPAYFALRARVPVVPVAINGTSWLGFGRPVRIRIGTPIQASGRPTHDAVAALTQQTQTALAHMLRDAPEPAPPGRFGRRLTEAFNEWPDGGRPALSGILSSDPADRGSNGIDRPVSRPD